MKFKIQNSKFKERGGWRVEGAVVGCIRAAMHPVNRGEGIGCRVGGRIWNSEYSTLREHQGRTRRVKPYRIRKWFSVASPSFHSLTHSIP